MKPNKTRIKIGGVKVTRSMVESVLEVLVSFDRMPDNPDLAFLREMVAWQLSERGLLNFVVFVCPNFRLDELSSANPERFVPTEARKDLLFTPTTAKNQGLAAATP
jgi:hypothetical protein